MSANSLTTASKWLASAQRQLKQASVTTARLDCLVLLEDEIGKDRSWLLSHPEYELQRQQDEKLNTQIARRATHVPLAYIRGKAEFYGREFAVNAHTLVPRPETETMIELLKQLTINDKRLTINDIGTGSGAIAITAKLEIPDATVIATDIDENCLQTARVNAERLGADVTFLQGNLLEPVYKRKTKNEKLVLLCNLPYVPDNFQINTAATHEPSHAIFGGVDGLDLYRNMFAQITDSTWKPSYIFTESLPSQHAVLAAFADANGYKLSGKDDFIQQFEKA